AALERRRALRGQRLRDRAGALHGADRSPRPRSIVALEAAAARRARARAGLRYLPKRSVQGGRARAGRARARWGHWGGASVAAASLAPPEPAEAEAERERGAARRGPLGAGDLGALAGRFGRVPVQGMQRLHVARG